MSIGWVWSAYNLFMLAVVLLILLDVPRPSDCDWFDLQRAVQIDMGDRSFWGMTTMMSEAGAEIALTEVDPVLVLLILLDVPRPSDCDWF
ncbi:hypothetical protein, partial [Baaleninema sp.]|uniref:hypothetical protein n=1 Tax=Baaleninema sp. TaxID=3101197 RepID=UPI003D029D09